MVIIKKGLRPLFIMLLSCANIHHFSFNQIEIYWIIV